MRTRFLAVLLLIPAAWSQSPAAKPVFEAASIKMTAPIRAALCESRRNVGAVDEKLRA